MISRKHLRGWEGGVKFYWSGFKEGKEIKWKSLSQTTLREFDFKKDICT